MSTRKRFDCALDAAEPVLRALDDGDPKEAGEIPHELLDAHRPEEIEDLDEDAEDGTDTDEERDGEANPDED